jgi:hypothetical protein
VASQWWHDPNYTHGFFVPVFSLFLVWERRAKLAALRSQPSWSGLVILLFALLALVLNTINSGSSCTASRCCFLSLAWWFSSPGGSTWRQFRFPWHFSF